mmetsp:Transcript_16332/g.35351  ORF Transcript_16332/g.35351 Transcript_16332/m.35351 type:complete len:220 (+) Transcript_16332:1020-1679(+)
MPAVQKIIAGWWIIPRRRRGMQQKSEATMPLVTTTMPSIGEPRSMHPRARLTTTIKRPRLFRGRSLRDSMTAAAVVPRRAPRMARKATPGSTSRRRIGPRRRRRSKRQPRPKRRSGDYRLWRMRFLRKRILSLQERRTMPMRMRPTRRGTSSTNTGETLSIQSPGRHTTSTKRPRRSRGRSPRGSRRKSQVLMRKIRKRKNLVPAFTLSLMMPLLRPRL